MAEYKNEEPCEFIYNITAVEKVVDGDTIDAVFDLGFDVRICNRIRLLGIDTPESRTRDLGRKVLWETRIGGSQIVGTLGSHVRQR